MQLLSSDLAPAAARLGLGWCLLFAPALASALPVLEIDSLVIDARYRLSPDFDLRILRSGTLSSDVSTTTAMQFSGNVVNEGTLLAGPGIGAPNPGVLIESFSRGAGISFVNARRGEIWAHNIQLAGSTTGPINFVSRGALRTGSFFQTGLVYPVGDTIVANASVLVGAEAAPTLPGEGSWISSGPVRVEGQGSVTIGEFGALRLSTAPPVGPSPVPHVFDLQPYSPFGLSAPELIVRGRVDVDPGTELLSSGRIEVVSGTDASGYLEFSTGSALRNKPFRAAVGLAIELGEITNNGTLSFGVTRDPANPSTFAVFENNGLVVSTQLLRLGQRGRLYNTGTVVVTGGTLEVASFGSPGATPWQGEVVNVRGTIQVLNGASVDMQGLMVNEGQFESAGLLTIGVDGRYQQGGSSALHLTRLGPGSVTRIRGDYQHASGETLLVGDLDASARMVIESTGRLSVFGFGPGEGFVMRDQAEVINEAGGQVFVNEGGRVTQELSVFTNRGSFQIGASGRWTAGRGLGVPPLTAQFINEENASVTVVGTWDGRGAVHNSGSFRVMSGGRVTVRDFRQLAGVLLIDADATLTTADEVVDLGDLGTLTIPGSLRMTGGLLAGSGHINGDVFGAGTAPVGPDVRCTNPDRPADVACFTPGNSPGTMTIDGALELSAGTLVELEVERQADGALAWDRLVASSMSFSQGVVVRVLLGEGVELGDSATLNLLDCTVGTCSLTAAAFEVTGGLGGVLGFAPDGGLIFTPTTLPIPEPTTALLMLGGLGLISWRRRATGCDGPRSASRPHRPIARGHPGPAAGTGC